MQDQIYEMLLKKDEITWQSLLLDLIKSEQMDPWDIDVSLLAQRYLEAVNKLQEADFFISGKVLLAAAILLRIKSQKLLSEDIPGFDNLLHPQEEALEELMAEAFERPSVDVPRLAIKSPQARKRRVSIHDLISALQKALEVNKRRMMRQLAEQQRRHPQIPAKTIDITQLIKDMYSRILSFFQKQEKITFNQLVRSDRKEDKILTFIPLLHLDNQEKIMLEQQTPFGEIEVLRKA